MRNRPNYSNWTAAVEQHAEENEESREERAAEGEAELAGRGGAVR